MSDAPLTFRKATASDVQAIVALLADDAIGRTREVVSDPPLSAYLDAFRAIDADSNQLLAVADRAGTVVGCLQITFIVGLTRQGAWRGDIEGVRVAAPERGHGVGRQLLEWAIAQCRTRNCRLVQLATDKQRIDAKRFYESLGFVASHEGMKLKL